MADKKKFEKIITDLEEVFFPTEASIVVNRLGFIVDFQQILPRTLRLKENKPSVVEIHKTLLLHPVLAKGLNEILTKNIQEFEKKFGKIKMPKKPKKSKNKKKTPERMFG